MKHALATLALLFALAFPAFAQDETETPAPPTTTVKATAEVTAEPPIIDVEEPPVIDVDAPVETDLQQAFERIVTLINSITYLPAAVGFVVAATALVKRVPGNTIPAATIAFTFQVLVWVVWVILRRFGVSEELFNSTLDAVTTILTGLAGLIATGVISQWVYNKSRASAVPVIGYSKTQ